MTAGNPADDTLAAAGDDLRDALHWETLIDRDLIVTNPPAADWRPEPKDLA